jgi:pimeloyl-ACP methyl ester carboxylesterase
MNSLTAVSARCETLGEVPGQLRYLVWGPSGDATEPPIILMHCMGANARSWQPVAQALAGHRWIYALDRRGHGGSVAAADMPLSFSQFRDDLLTLLGTLGIDKVIGIGHSAGATDLLLAATRTGVFDSLILVEPTVLCPGAHRSDADTLSVLSETIIARLQRRPDTFATAAAARTFLMTHSALELSTWHPDALAGYFADGLVTVDPGSTTEVVCSSHVEAHMLGDILRVSEGLYPGSEFERLDTVDCPVHLLLCDRSRATFQMMGAVCARVIGTSVIHRQPEASHFLPQTDPTRFVTLVRSLINDDRSTGSTWR